MEVITVLDDLLGNPVDSTSGQPVQVPAAAAMQEVAQPQYQQQQQQYQQQPQYQQQQQQQQQYQQQSQQQQYVSAPAHNAGGPIVRQPQVVPGGQSMVMPISALNPFMHKWTIKVRVTAKTPIKTWSNVRGEGKLFSIDMLDEHGGEIRGAFFNAGVDKFYESLKVGANDSVTQTRTFSARCSRSRARLFSARTFPCPRRHD